MDPSVSLTDEDIANVTDRVRRTADFLFAFATQTNQAQAVMHEPWNPQTKYHHDRDSLHSYAITPDIDIQRLDWGGGCGPSAVVNWCPQGMRVEGPGPHGMEHKSEAEVLVGVPWALV